MTDILIIWECIPDNDSTTLPGPECGQSGKLLLALSCPPGRLRHASSPTQVA